MHIGPVYLMPTIALTNLGIDNNVFNSGGGPESDFTLTLRPALGVALPFGRRALLTASTGLGVDYYRKFKTQRSLNGSVASRFEYYLNRITIFADGSDQSTRQRPNYEIDARIRRREQTANAGFEVRVFRKLYLEPSAGVATSRFEDGAVYDGVELRQTLDRDSRFGSLAAKWRATALTTLAVRAEGQADRFLYATERNADTARVMVGMETRPRALISGAAYIGVQRFHTLSSELPDRSGITARADLTYTLLGSTGFTFTARRDVGYSFERDEPYYAINTYGLDVRRYLGGGFSVAVGALRNSYGYQGFVGSEEPQAAPEAGPRGARLDTTWNYTASVAYGAPRGTQIGVLATYFDRGSTTEPTRAYNTTRIGMFVVHAF